MWTKMAPKATDGNGNVRCHLTWTNYYRLFADCYTFWLLFCVCCFSFYQGRLFIMQPKTVVCQYSFNSLVILYLYLEVIARESPIAPNDSLFAPKQHTKSLPKSARRKNGKFTKTFVTNLHNFINGGLFLFSGVIRNCKRKFISIIGH